MRLPEEKKSPTPEPPRSQLNHYDFPAFLALADSERDGWRWDGILPVSGTVLVVGQPHAGKTTLVAALAAAMSAKLNLAGRTVRPGRLLLASLEHQARDVAKTLAAAARGAGIAPAELRVAVVRAPLDLDNPEHFDELDRIASKRKARVIVIDPFRRSSRIDENRAEDVSVYCQSLQRLTRNGKRLVIVIHHLTKNGELPRGSMDFVASVDSWIKVTRSRKDVVTIDATHHGAAPLSLRLVVSRDDDKLLVEEEPKGTVGVPDKLKEQVLVAIEANPESGRRDIRAAVRSKIHASHELVDRAVDELATEGLIENVGTGVKHKWVLHR